MRSNNEQTCFILPSILVNFKGDNLIYFEFDFSSLFPLFFLPSFFLPLSLIKINALSFHTATLCGTEFKCHSCAVRLQGRREYGVVVGIYSDQQETFFRIQVLQVLQFQAAYHAYRIQRTQNFEIIAINEACLLHALPIWIPFELLQPEYISDRTSDLSFFPPFP